MILPTREWKVTISRLCAQDEDEDEDEDHEAMPRATKRKKNAQAGMQIKKTIIKRKEAGEVDKEVKEAKEKAEEKPKEFRSPRGFLSRSPEMIALEWAPEMGNALEWWSMGSDRTRKVRGGREGKTRRKGMKDRYRKI